MSKMASSSSGADDVPVYDASTDRHFAPANSGFVLPNAIPGAKPGASEIIDLAQLDKALREIKDGNMRVIAENSSKFFRLAVGVIAQSLQGDIPADLKESYDMIRITYGDGIDGVNRLAALLREVAIKKKMDEVLKQISTAKVTSGSEEAKGTVGASLSGKSPFRF